MPRETPNPTFQWYLQQRPDASFPPRCPFADADLCPRFYDSVRHLGDNGITTPVSGDDKVRLDAKWSRAAGLIDEELPTTLSSERGWHSISNICPEVGYETFGFFATSFYRYADELDHDLAHQELGRTKEASGHYRWTWAMVSPLHYVECRIYSVLSGLHSRGQTWTAAIPPREVRPLTPARNDRFTETERRELVTKLDDLLLRVRTQAILSSGEFEVLSGQIQDAKLAADRLGRKDWVMFFLGSIAGVVLPKIVDSDAAKALWNMVTQLIASVVHQAPALGP